MPASPFLDRVKVNTSTSGTGTVTLGSAVSPYQSFAAGGAVNGSTYTYLIEDGTAWEIGQGVYNSSTPSLTRNLRSSSTGALLSLDGSSTVSIIAGSADLISSGQRGGNTVFTANASFTVSAAQINGQFNITTGANNIILTPPASGVGQTIGDTIQLTKVDTGNGTVAVAGMGTLMGGGNDLCLFAQGDFLELCWDGTNWQPTYRSIAPKMDVYTANGSYTWTKYPLLKMLEREYCGGGGGGGSGAVAASIGQTTAFFGGQGGGCGQFQQDRLDTAKVTKSIAITIGLGGAGGAAATAQNSGNAGSNGGDTTFQPSSGYSDFAIAKGGEFGLSGAASSNSEGQFGHSMSGNLLNLVSPYTRFSKTGVGNPIYNYSYYIAMGGAEGGGYTGSTYGAGAPSYTAFGTNSVAGGAASSSGNGGAGANGSFQASLVGTPNWWRGQSGAGGGGAVKVGGNGGNAAGFGYGGGGGGGSMNPSSSGGGAGAGGNGAPGYAQFRSVF